MTAPATAPDLTTIDTEVRAVLDWSLRSGPDAVRSLYHRAVQEQWDVATAVDWTQEVGFGRPIGPLSTRDRSRLEASPLRSGGSGAWSAWLWELQGWMVCQFLHGEQAATVASARLVETLPSVTQKLYAASQCADEARHYDAFSRYVTEHVPEPFELSKPLRLLFADALGARDSHYTILGIQCLLEPVALAGFRLAEATFHDDLIKQILRLIARDEARHVAFGILLLQDEIPQMTAAELRDREDFVLASSELLARRFLLEEVWDRVGVPVRLGHAFAREDQDLVGFRRAMFARSVPLLRRVGMLSPRLVDGLRKLDLVAPG